MKKLLKALLISALCPILCLQLSSCFDDREMNELAYVIALGIDTSENGEYNYTFQISNPLASGGGGEEKPSKEINPDDKSEQKETKEWTEFEIEDNKNQGVTEIVVKAENYSQAVSIVNNIISKRVNLAHIKLIVLSEEVCREGMERHTRFLMSEREIRPGTNIAVAKKSAEYFLKNVNPKLDMSTAKYYELLINDENMTYSDAVELRDFYDKGFGKNQVDGILPLGGVSDYNKSAYFSNNSEENGHNLVSGKVNRLANEKTEFFGAAVINDMNMVGVLNGEEVKFYKLALGKLEESGIFLINGKSCPLKNCRKSRIFVDTDGEAPKITVNLYIETENAENVEEIKDSIEKNIYAVLFKTAKEYGADIFGFSNYAKRNFLTWREFENYGWNEKYKNSDFYVKVDIKNSKVNTARYIFE